MMLSGLLQGVALAAVQVVLEVIALDELHDQKSDVAVAVGVIDADDVGMLQPCGRTRLGAKARFVFGGGFLGQVLDLDGLDGHAPVQVGIPALINDAHGPLAQHADQIVSTKFLETHGNGWGVVRGEMILAVCIADAMHAHYLGRVAGSRLMRMLSRR
jgi:hypothetical protein